MEISLGSTSRTLAVLKTQLYYQVYKETRCNSKGYRLRKIMYLGYNRTKQGTYVSYHCPGEPPWLAFTNTGVRLSLAKCPQQAESKLHSLKQVRILPTSVSSKVKKGTLSLLVASTSITTSGSTPPRPNDIA